MLHYSRGILTTDRFHTRRVRAGLLGLVLGLALGGSCAFGAMTFLHTQGQDMVDDAGQKVLLKGVGLGNWMLPEGYMWKFGNEGDRPRKIEKIVSDLIGPEKAAQFWSEYRKNYVTEADIQRISELGFNSVRPALNARLFLSEGENPAYLDEGFALLDHLVAWGRKHHVYVIIDMHGAPGGQTGANIDDSANDQPELFMDQKYQDRLVNLWVKIASRYKDEPAVAAYDLLNEPLPQRTGAAPKYKAALEPLYKRLTQAIREVDKKHMITVEGADWANDWSVFSEPFDGNLFYQFHYYCWDNPIKLKGVDRYLELRAKFNAPIWGGETGEADATIYWGTTEYFEQNNIGWSFWPWKKMDTGNTPYSIKPPEGWEAIRAYSQGKDKPSPEAGQKAFDQLLQNIRLANCTACPSVVNAIFRRVPGRVEAENYGHEGVNKSYCVKAPAQNAKLYRTSEPVTIVPVEREGSRRHSGSQAIVLNAQEWTAYTVNNLKRQAYSGTIRLMATAPAVLEVSLGNQAPQVLNVTQTGWIEMPLTLGKFARGANPIKVSVTSGTVTIDWLEFK